MAVTHAQLWKALDALAADRGLTPSGLARRAGLDPTSFNPSKRIGAGDPPRARWPSTESLARTLEALDASWVEFAALAQDDAPRRVTVPMLGLAQAGTGGFFDREGFPTGDGWDETELPTATRTTISIRIQGDSMLPLYRDGDRVIVDRADGAVTRGDRVVVETCDGEVMAKEIASLNPKRVTLASLNPAHEPRILPLKEVAWMSRILWVSQ